MVFSSPGVCHLGHLVRPLGALSDIDQAGSLRKLIASYLWRLHGTMDEIDLAILEFYLH